MAKSVCAQCPLREECFVEEKQKFFSYGFYGRKLSVSRHRAKKNDPEMQDFLNLRAGAESMINELFHKTGKRAKFTGKERVKTGGRSDSYRDQYRPGGEIPRRPRGRRPGGGIGGLIRAVVPIACLIRVG